MRTTLTLDADVSARLERLRKEQALSLKQAVNTALREGLDHLDRPAPGERNPFRTRSVDLGTCRVHRLDDVAEALARAEGDDWS